MVVLCPSKDWIDRVDLASQYGLPTPLFETLEGEPIFPEDEDPWWLTDVSRKVKEEGEKAEGDEDGPPSELEEEQRAEVSASESESKARVGRVVARANHM